LKSNILLISFDINPVALNVTQKLQFISQMQVYKTFSHQ
jgi:hypothetical protein